MKYANTVGGQNKEFLCAFEILRKVTIRCTVSVQPSFRLFFLMEQLVSTGLLFMKFVI